MRLAVLLAERVPNLDTLLQDLEVPRVRHAEEKPEGKELRIAQPETNFCTGKTRRERRGCHAGRRAATRKNAKGGLLAEDTDEASKNALPFPGFAGCFGRLLFRGGVVGGDGCYARLWIGRGVRRHQRRNRAPKP